MKVVLNVCYGGFGVSQEALTYIRQCGYSGQEYEIPRNLPALVEAVEFLGEKANAACADLCVKEVEESWLGQIFIFDGKEDVCYYSDCDTHVKIIPQRELVLAEVRQWLTTQSPNLVVEFDMRFNKDKS